MFSGCGVEEISIGEAFTLQASLPEKTWHNTKGEAFTPETIPVGVADTYRSFTTVSNITLSEYAKVIKVDDGPFTLTATVTPADAFNGAIGWSSSDIKVATVDATGRVTPVSPGTTTITASAGTLSAQCTLTVLDADGEITPVESVTLDKATATLTGKETVQLSASISPADATYNGVRWTSSNEGVALVSQLGVVAAKGKGTTTITATSLDGAASATCMVTVRNPPTSLAFSAAPSQLKIDQTEKLSVVTTGDLPGATEDVGQIDWMVSDSGIASLASSGASANITGRSVGGVTVQAKASYGGKNLLAETGVEVIWADAESVTLDSASHHTIVGADGITLAASISPESASGAAISWSSTDPEVASVDQAGNVLIHKAGTAKIYARVGAVYAECLVEVDARSIPSSEDSDLDGYLLVEDSELARSLDGLQLVVNNNERKSDLDMRKAAVDAIDGQVALADLYDIYMVDMNGYYRPWSSPSADPVTVCVALSEPLKAISDSKDLFVRYISDDLGSKEMMETSVQGSQLTFNTTNFSTHAGLAKDKQSGAVDEGVRNDTSVSGDLAQTGDAMGAFVVTFSLLALASAASVVVVRRRMKQQG